MLYLIYGTDSTRAREKTSGLVASLLKKRPDALCVCVTDETFDSRQLDEHTYGQGLFSQKYIIVFDSVFLREDAQKIITPLIKDIAVSDNIFIFLEEKVPTPLLAKFQKHAQKMQVFAKKQTSSSATAFDMFSLTDAFGARDKKQMWVLYHKARRTGISNEEIHDLLFWQAKSMALATDPESAGEAGLKPFV